MTRFVINANHTRYFATGEITEISPGKKRVGDFGGYYHEAKLRDGSTITIDGHDADDLTDAIIAVIPAAPGYSTIETGNCLNGEAYTTREPVLAWQMMQTGEMRPVTIRGPNNGLFCTKSISVEQPNGEVWCPSEDAIYHDFDSFRVAALEAAAVDERDRAAAQIARKAKLEEQA